MNVQTTPLTRATRPSRRPDRVPGERKEGKQMGENEQKVAIVTGGSHGIVAGYRDRG